MSEFGKGLTYCLGMFLAHAERKQIELCGKTDYSLWFNGAADHLFELMTPETLPETLQARLTSFQDKCLGWRLCLQGKECTKGDYEWAIEETKALLMLIDEHMGVEVESADYA